MDIDKKKCKELLNTPKCELIETIMMYQEALEAMTEERNFWRREAIT